MLGTFSAAGMAEADVVRDASRSVLAALADTDADSRARLAAPLEGRLLGEMKSEGFEANEVVMTRTLDLRYRGQSFELGVPEGVDPAVAFHGLHRQRYGHARPEVPVELVTLRLRAVGRVSRAPLEAEPEEPRSLPAEDGGHEAWFQGTVRPSPLFRRDSLQPGQRLQGPTIIAEDGATTLVPPGWWARVDGFRNIRMNQGVAP